MYCRSCGMLNADGAAACIRCGALLHVPPHPPTAAGGVRPSHPIPSYLAQSILVTLFCCLPAGIVAIVYAAQVDAKARAGDIAGALASSAKARKWAWISFGVGLAIGALWLGGAFLSEVTRR